MATIRITNLKLRAFIGTEIRERKRKQKITVNIKIDFDETRPCESDDIKDAVDYQIITRAIIEKVENSRFFLIEKLAKAILDIVMRHPLVREATVRLDKPGAIRFADSVSVELIKRRE
ncbi:MAG TPA: dihydroneopterin aldolase [Candidatus Omnitrophota bacterium]|nr:dihydroneopterin aldolase [Candidatus Omnitrophota bacterium]